MNELLQKHGCSNVFTIPEGLRELMSDIAREVLREQPPKIFDFIANYLSALLITREHGILAVKILDDLCDCRPSVSEHLLQLGLERNEAEMLAEIIKEEIEGFEPVEGKEKVKEMQIIKKILMKTALDEHMSGRVCQVARNAYRDYWYRKQLMEKNLKVHPEEPWEIAAHHTLELYKRTKPSFSELTRATQKIQAAYRGYHVRRNLLRHLKPKKKPGPKVELPGPPLDVAASREIDLGPVIDIKVREDDVGGMFQEDFGEKLGLQYDPMTTLTHVEDEQEYLGGLRGPSASRLGKMQSRAAAVSKSSTSRSEVMEMQEGPKSTAEVAKPRQMPSQFEAMPSEMETGPRQSRLMSQVPEGPRQSRLQSKPSSTEDMNLQKISFSQVPVVIGEEEIPEVDAQEVPEELGVEAIAATDVAPEGSEIATAGVPEDIPDDRTDGDGESAPTASVPSSAPDTANTTDVEDAGEDIVTTEEEEG